MKLSLRKRMALLSATAVALAVVLALAGSYLVTRERLRGQVDETLESQARTAQRLIGRRSAEQLLSQIRAVPSQLGVKLAGGIETQAQLLSSNGSVRPVTTDVAELPVTTDDRRIAAAGEGTALNDVEVGAEHLRVITVGLSGNGAIQLAHSLEGVDEVIADLRLTLALIAVAGVGLAALLGWLIAARVTAPIRSLSDAAEHISATEDLSRRIEVRGDDEVARLAARFNTMLATIERSQSELERSVEAQRQLVADASHELRTPIASVRTDIEVLAEHPDLGTAERTSIVADAAARIEELSDLVADVIELDRGEEPSAEPEEVRLDLLAAESVSWARGHFPEHSFTCDLEPTVVVSPSQRLARAIDNLLDNACKYSTPGLPIAVTVRDGELSVRDHGPGVVAAEREQIFDRFRRGRSVTGQPGSGLGLAIVRQVAESCGGSVEIHDAPGGGADFRLRLPPVPREPAC